MTPTPNASSEELREKVVQLCAHMVFDVPLKVPATFMTVTPNQMAAIDKLVQLITAEGEKSRLRGYNSGWVKANRLAQKPETIEYFASQLEDAAKTLRAAIETMDVNHLQPEGGGDG